MARQGKKEWDADTRKWMAKVGQKLRSARQSNDKTLAKLASDVELTQPTLSRIENGRQEFLASYFRTFARALGIPVSDLIPDEPEPSLPHVYPICTHKHHDPG